MADQTISIARDFSPYPAGRTPGDGPFNGQRFRESLLVPAMERAIAANAHVMVEFGGADSYSSSFLEEVFGGLVRAGRFPAPVISRVLRLRTDDPVFDAYVLDARTYLQKELTRTAA
jgi:hypothetical protein